MFSLDSLFGSFLLLRQVLDDFFFLSQETLLSAFAGLLCLWAASFGLVTGWKEGGDVSKWIWLHQGQLMEKMPVSHVRKMTDMKKQLTTEASCEPYLPSVCGCAPWGCVCFWRHYPWPSDRDCGTCTKQKKSQSISKTRWFFNNNHTGLFTSNVHWNSHLHVPVNFLGLPVATEKTTKDSHAPHPGQLLWHTSIGSTLSLTWAGQK